MKRSTIFKLAVLALVRRGPHAEVLAPVAEAAALRDGAAAAQAAQRLPPRLQRAEHESQRRKVWIPRWQWPLAISLLLWVLSLRSGVGRKSVLRAPRKAGGGAERAVAT